MSARQAPVAMFRLGRIVATPNALEKLSQQEVLRGMESFVGENLSFLVPVDKAWQPSDYLPDLTAPDWREQMHIHFV